MQVVASLLMVLVGIGLLAAARYPHLPLLRSIYIWRIIFKNDPLPDPLPIDRQVAAASGLFWIALGVGMLLYLSGPQ